MANKRNVSQSAPEVNLMRQFQTCFLTKSVDSIARAPNIQTEFVYLEHSSIVSDFWIYIRAQVPLEEEEGALDDANFNFGDDCGQCYSQKEGAKDDSKIDPNRQHTRNFFRDVSILSTTESVEALLEEDEVIYLLASIKAAAP